MRTIRSLALAGMAMILAVGAAADGLDARRITRENAAELVRAGTDAVGGVDDWFLGNGVVCAILTDPSHESDIAVSGGALADLGLCGREDDQFILYQELLNHSMQTPVVVERVRAEVDETRAALIAEGGREDLRVVTRYSVDQRVPRRLEIRTEVTRTAPGPKFMGIAGGVANVRSLEPFATSLDPERPARGYVHPSWTGQGAGALRKAAVSSELVIATGPPRQQPGVAYGQRLVSASVSAPNAKSRKLPAYFLPEGIATVLAVFSEPFWFGQSRLGWLQLLQARRVDLDEGSTLTIAQELWVGERADAASVTDLLLPRAPRVSGRCDDPGCSVHIDRKDGTPFTERRADADGRFSVRVPTGEWKLRVRGTAGREVERKLHVDVGDLDVGTLEVGAIARVRLPRNGPMRLVFIGEDGTPDPNWSDDLRGYRLGANDGQFRSFRPLRDLHLTGTDWDPVSVAIPPGRYRVIATRGPEFGLSHANFEVRAGREVVLSIASPLRVIETPGWISADLHVHGAASFDTPTLNDHRVASYVAEGAEVLVSSDHENVHDYGPDVARMGLGDRLATVVGLEVTGEVRTAEFPNSTGHANVIPMPRDPYAYRRGTVANENRRWRDIIGDLRSLPGERLVQLNHARSHRIAVHWRTFLSHMGAINTPYDPSVPLTEEPNRILIDPDPQSGLRDLDFDAMEILNGPYPESGELMVRDWLSFLVQGERLTGTANSDSHTLEAVVGVPRNYVQVADDRVEAFDEDEFVTSLSEGRACGTTGPWLSIEVGGAGPGEMASGASPTLEATIRSASWVDVDRLRVWRNTELMKEVAIPEDRAISEALDFDSDGLVFVEVVGEASGDYAEILGGHRPYAFCNPIRVDADSDGVWRAPGLPIVDRR